MVNKIVLEYLRKHSKKYKVEALKQKIISSGYSPEEVDEALVALGLKKLTDVVKPIEIVPEPVKSEVIVSKEFKEPAKKEAVKEPSKSFFKGLFSGQEKKEVKKSIVVPSKKVEAKKVIFKKPVLNVSKQPSLYKWLKVAGVSSLILIVLFVLFYIFLSGLLGGDVYILSPFSFVSFLLIALFSILFYFGFILLGKRFDNKLLGIASWAFIIAIVVFILFQIFFMIFPDIIENIFFNAVSLDSPEIIEKMNLGELAGTFIKLFVLIVIVVSVMAVLNVLFGIGLMKLKAEYSKLAGILHIVGGASLFVGIGALILLVALIFDCALLFKISKNI